MRNFLTKNYQNCQDIYIVRNRSSLSDVAQGILKKLLDFTKDFSSLQRKCQKFSWGLRPQTPTYFLPVYIQYANLILSPSYILPVNIQLLPPSISHLSTFTRPQDFYSLQRKFQKFPGGFAPRPLISPSCLHSTSPPYISFLSIFTRPQDCPQTPS